MATERERRTVPCVVRFTESENETLLREADRAGRTKSGYLRWLHLENLRAMREEGTPIKYCPGTFDPMNPGG